MRMSHFLKRILVSFHLFFLNSLKQTWIVHHHYLHHLVFLAIKRVQFAELFSDGHLIFCGLKSTAINLEKFLI